MLKKLCDLREFCGNFEEIIKFVLKEKGSLFIDGLIFQTVEESLVVPHLISKVIPSKIIELILAVSSGNRELIFQEISKGDYDLKVILRILQKFPKLSNEKLMSILNKLLQIYRSKGIRDWDFESQMFFEYERIGTDKEDLENLKGQMEDEDTITTTNTRISFRLDLEKNGVPIESIKLDECKKIEPPSPSSSSFSFSFSRLKQRLLNEFNWRAEEGVVKGILQSPDKSFFIFYSNLTIYFWDYTTIFKKSIPIASVNPRADAVITSMIFYGPDSILISFKDGIIGHYK